jgi:hypothetical protein
VDVGVAGELVVVLGGCQLHEVLRTTRCERPDRGAAFRLGARFLEGSPAGERSLRSAIVTMHDRQTDAVFVDQT